MVAPFFRPFLGLPTEANCKGWPVCRSFSIGWPACHSLPDLHSLGEVDGEGWRAKMDKEIH